VSDKTTKYFIFWWKSCEWDSIHEELVAGCWSLVRSNERKL